MLTPLRRFLSDDRGSLMAHSMMLVATILLLGAALALVALERSLNEPVLPPIPIEQNPAMDQLGT